MPNDRLKRRTIMLREAFCGGVFFVIEPESISLRLIMMIFCAPLTPLNVAIGVVECYVGYRVFRTLFALLSSIMVYKVIPIFRKPNLKKYKQRWTVVTGGTDGIGKAYTFELARRGLRKFFMIGRNQSKLDAVRKQLETEFSAKVQTFLFDFFDGDYKLLREELSTLDVGFAVNSVGVGREYLERFGDNPVADWQILKVNGLGASEFLSCILPPMEKHGGGQIINLSSSQGIRPIALLAAYSSAKAMLCFVSDCIDREYKTIKCQCLTPAIIATKMTYYENGGIFVVTPKNFVNEAINSIGLVTTTSGCFNHEIQLLLMHMFPWTLLKYLMMPIYWYQQRRMIKLLGDNGKDSKAQAVALQKDNNNNDSSRPESPATADPTDAAKTPEFARQFA